MGFNRAFTGGSSDPPPRGAAAVSRFMPTSILNLITGELSTLSPEEEAYEEHMTSEFKKRLGECDCACRYSEPYGWVPEAGCPVHD